MRFSIALFLIGFVLSCFPAEVSKFGIALSCTMLFYWAARATKLRVAGLGILLLSIAAMQFMIFLKGNSGAWHVGPILGDITYGFRLCILAPVELLQGIKQAAIHGDYSSLDVFEQARFAFTSLLILVCAVPVLFAKKRMEKTDEPCRDNK
jgi:hypothetical protein